MSGLADESGAHTRGAGSALDFDGQLRGATDFGEPLSIALHLRIVRQPQHGVFQDFSCCVVVGLDDPIVHPRAFSSCADDAGSSQVGEMPADLGLIRFQNLNEETDTDFVRAY